MTSWTSWGRVALLVMMAWLSLLAFGTEAHAQSIADPATGFRVRFDAPGARVCVVLPRGMENPEACAGLDVEAARAQLAAMKSQSPFAVIRVTEGDEFLAVTMTSYPRMALTTEKDLLEYLGGAQESAHELGGAAAKLHGDAPGSPYDELSVNGMRVIRYAWDNPTPRAGPAWHSLDYVVLGPSSTVSVSVISNAADAVGVRAIAERMMATASLPTVTKAEPSNAATELGGKLANLSVGCALFVGLVVLWMDYERRAARVLGAAARQKSAARGSWLSVLVAVSGMVFARGGGEALVPVAEVSGTLLMIAGLLAGLYALASVPRHGRPGILVPGLLGVAGHLSLLSLAFVAIVLR